MLPFGLDQTDGKLILGRQGQSEALMWSWEVVKGTGEEDSPSLLAAVFAEAQGHS